MRASILTIGDEILIGQILNSNTQWISTRLTDLGISVSAHLTIADDQAAIAEALNTLKPMSDIIIIGGGLGPTHDDLTMQTLSQHFKIPLKEDSEWLNQIRAFFTARGRVMSDNNLKQGQLLQDTTRIDNDCGTAAGQYFLKNSIHYFVVPGVPHEMKSMMERFILPKIAELNHGSSLRILKTTLMTTGIGESSLAERLDPVVKKIQATSFVSLAFLPNLTGVRLRLQGQVQDRQQETEYHALLTELKALCKDDYYGEDPATLEEWIIESLTQKNQTLSCAESCTGGYLSHRLTMIAGSSQVFKGGVIAYQNEIKTQLLTVSPKMLAEHGPVSEETAKAMAEGVRQQMKTTYGLSITGYLGKNNGDEHTPAGTVWIALASDSGTLARKFYYESDRGRGKERASQSAMDLLRRSENLRHP